MWLCSIRFLPFPSGYNVSMDLKYDRYKTVIRSVILVVIGMLGFVCVGIICSLLASENSNTGVITVTTCAGIVGFVATLISLVLWLILSSLAWTNSPGEDRTLFIHWYVCMDLLCCCNNHSLIKFI